jgi:AbrB family looped-hinge helix DNA binding protein
MHTSRLTQKFQATIPLQIRRILSLRQGDLVAFEVENGRVTLRKAVPIDLEYARAVEQTLTEWNSEADEEAYRDL